MNHKKIADLAHVSPSTVSKALSGSSEISEEVSARVLKIALECGYFNEKKKRKREYTNNHSLLIAVLVPELLGHHYSEIVTRLKGEIEARGALVAIYVYDFSFEKRDNILKNIILSGAADGIIAIDGTKLPKTTQIPLVFIGGTPVSSYDSITTDRARMMKDSVDYLFSLGHTKIGFIGEPHTVAFKDGFEDAMNEAGLELDPKHVITVCARHEAIGIEAAKQLLALENKPTAVIAAYDIIALSLIHELEKSGVNVPDEISIMGINNISASAYANVPLTSVDTFSAEQYRTAVTLLFDKIFERTDAVHHITLEHKIVERASTQKLDTKNI